MPNRHILSPFKTHRHDHKRCIESALTVAEHTCLKSGLRLTKIRRQVLRLVWARHAPIKAYDILEQLHKANPRTAPPTVYRALDFLIEAGLVHKIEILNSYVGCGDPSKPHIGQFLICETCGAVAEIDEPKITKMLAQEARQLGFHAHRQVVEINGQCPKCV